MRSAVRACLGFAAIRFLNDYPNEMIKSQNFS